MGQVDGECMAIKANHTEQEQASQNMANEIDLGIIEGEVDKRAQKIDICPDLMLGITDIMNMKVLCHLFWY